MTPLNLIIMHVHVISFLRELNETCIFYYFQAVAGNIMTASPISDLNPLFLAAGVTLTVASKGQSLLEILVSLYHYSYRRIHEFYYKE